ncbi:hypothetical protein Tco_0739299 [Tanacetum coccineum]
MVLQETDTLLSHFNDSSPDYETFCFDIKEKSSGSTTSHSDLSLLDYEVFCFEEKSSGNTTSHSNHSLPEYESFCFDVNHIKEKSSGSTTSHSNLSLLEYESFHFDLLIDPLPPADRSDSHHEEFADELAHIISPQEYDHFYFDLEANPGELTRLLKENISETPTKDLKINELNDFPLFLSDYPFVEIPSGESKVHIEVLSVLWGNRLPIPDGLLPLSRKPDVSVFKRVDGIPEVEIRLLAVSVRTPDVSVV